LVSDVEGHVPDTLLVEEVCTRGVLGLTGVGAVEELPVFWASMFYEICDS